MGEREVAQAATLATQGHNGESSANPAPKPKPQAAAAVQKKIPPPVRPRINSTLSRRPGAAGQDAVSSPAVVAAGDSGRMSPTSQLLATFRNVNQLLESGSNGEDEDDDEFAPPPPPSSSFSPPGTTPTTGSKFSFDLLPPPPLDVNGVPPSPIDLRHVLPDPSVGGDDAVSAATYACCSPSPPGRPSMAPVASCRVSLLSHMTPCPRDRYRVTMEIQGQAGHLQLKEGDAVTIGSVSAAGVASVTTEDGRRGLYVTDLPCPRYWSTL